MKTKLMQFTPQQIEILRSLITNQLERFHNLDATNKAIVKYDELVSLKRKFERLNER